MKAKTELLSKVSDIDKNKLSAIFYIDGSCRPTNPGYVGWGVHGYTYNGISIKSFSSESFFHTNHGYLNINQELNNKTFHVEPIQYIDGLGSHSVFLSNNAAEILGLYNILKYIENKDLYDIHIYTDSEYLRQSINDWCPKWSKNNWLKQDGSEISNKNLIEQTYLLFKSIKEKSNSISLSWIRSHNGHLGNERADILAGIGGSYSQNNTPISSIEISPARGYWKTETERNPYIAFRRLYFNSVIEYHRPGVYYLTESTNPESSEGKAIATAGYSVVYLNEPDRVIEEIKNKQFEVSKGINAIILMKLDSVYNKNIYPWISEHGGKALMGQSNGHSLNLVNKSSVTVEQNPTGLSQRTLDYLALIEEFLAGFEEHLESNEKWLVGAHEVVMHEITELFFSNKVNGKGVIKQELKPEFVVGFKFFPIEVNIEHNGKNIPIKIPYVLGYDCLPRNNLKYLEGKEPKIYLLTWKESEILRYATIIKSNFGIGIWSNYFANQIVLPAINNLNQQ